MLDGDYLHTLILTHTHVSPLHQRAKSYTGHNRPIGHGCCFTANYSVCFAKVLLLLALKQFSAPLVGYASALLVQSLFWNIASQKGFLYSKCCSIHPMEKSLQGDPTRAWRRSWNYILTKSLWSCPLNVFNFTSLTATVFTSFYKQNKLKRQLFNHGSSHLEKQRIWKDIFQKSCQLLAVTVMCLSKAFYLITEIQKSKEALGALPSPLLSHYLSGI